ncbi:MAG: hypothetical protein ACHQHN_07195 [Sphingobacteriales bacterium]
MKTIKNLLLIAAAGMLITACRFGKHTTIVENGNGHNLRIESYGKVYFNPAGTDIAYISRGGYLEYKNNDKHLKAENDGHGGIRYELDDDGQKLKADSNGREFIAQAIRVMIQKGYQQEKH